MYFPSFGAYFICGICKALCGGYQPAWQRHSIQLLGEYPSAYPDLVQGPSLKRIRILREVMKLLIAPLGKTRKSILKCLANRVHGLASTDES